MLEVLGPGSTTANDDGLRANRAQRQRAGSHCGLSTTYLQQTTRLRPRSFRRTTSTLETAVTTISTLIATPTNSGGNADETADLRGLRLHLVGGRPTWHRVASTSLSDMVTRESGSKQCGSYDEDIISKR
eukprot:TRINITY_DN44116_c0_g1_i1.p1 TRINITY_DN44116_c0_g1~~TRINITY_DN44116_c0_g1_i1.p1  ORF type:complete len:130 (-),score=4.64 TRINITY_DN44116_c0_g1_i1:179-568(-)